MVDVFPRRNLNPDAEQWGRALETKTVSNEQAVEILGQQLQSQNRNIASSLSVMAGQIERVVEQQEELEAQQIALAAQNATLQSTIAFLSTQTLYDQRSGVSGGSVPGVGGGSFAYYSYDPTYDCEITVTTAASGKLLLSAGGAISSSGGGAGIGPEVVGGSLPDFTTSATAGNDAAVGASRSILVTVAPNTTYTVRTRRWYYGESAQFVSYQAASLVVTRLA